MHKLWEVWRAFWILGLTSFGGPVAHLGYFRAEFVEKRRWLSDQAYAELVTLCQFLPGPASSQVGFGLGFLRAGLPGALLAWLAFTAPSAIVLILFAGWLQSSDSALLGDLLHGLKVVAVAIVAHAVMGMAKNLCPDRQRASLAILALALVLLLGGIEGQLLAILAGAVGGWWWCQQPLDQSTGKDGLAFEISRSQGLVILALFLALLLLLPLLAAGADAAPGLQVLDSFYRAGALVFGGGHVVLPLLDAETVQMGRVTADSFLAGYGATQAMPGPVFTFAGFLGAEWAQSLAGNGLLVIQLAILALIAVFLPGFLLLLGVLPFWQALGQRPGIRAAMAGANAAVVGLLGAALYQPVFVSSVTSVHELVLALLCLLLLTSWKAPSWLVVLVGAAGGLLLGQLA
ncbi:chromate efflux transporter [Oceanobacter mangrovi]|uniref:chromate efflux transporter n=1 Tax=Oceanobacter mangrovi TaxID=2862510 RepID=UPI001C8E5F3E|nr:chromate efflux transporter [Oceanobacter mangrovi]